MPIPERFNPGLEHVRAYSEGENLVRAQFVALMSKARAAWEASRMFPWTNGGRPVLFGAPRACGYLAEYLMDAANALHWVLDRDYVDLVRFEHAYVSGRFVTREELAKEYPHIVREVARLRAKLEGKTR